MKLKIVEKLPFGEYFKGNPKQPSHVADGIPDSRHAMAKYGLKARSRQSFSGGLVQSERKGPNCSEYLDHGRKK